MKINGPLHDCELRQDEYGRWMLCLDGADRGMVCSDSTSKVVAADVARFCCGMLDVSEDAAEWMAGRFGAVQRVRKE